MNGWWLVSCAFALFQNGMLVNSEPGLKGQPDVTSVILVAEGKATSKPNTDRDRNIFSPQEVTLGCRYILCVT